jgi:hypothetical protein
MAMTELLSMALIGTILEESHPQSTHLAALPSLMNTSPKE